MRFSNPWQIFEKIERGGDDKQMNDGSIKMLYSRNIVVSLR